MKTITTALAAMLLTASAQAAERLHEERVTPAWTLVTDCEQRVQYWLYRLNGEERRDEQGGLLVAGAVARAMTLRVNEAGNPVRAACPVTQ